MIQMLITMLKSLNLNDLVRRTYLLRANIIIYSLSIAMISSKFLFIWTFYTRDYRYKMSSMAVFLIWPTITGFPRHKLHSCSRCTIRHLPSYWCSVLCFCFVCLHTLFFMANVTCISGLSILDCPFIFL